MSEKRKDNPGVIAPPPLIFATGLIVGGFVAWHYPRPIMASGAAVVLGCLLVLFGLVVIFVAWRQMKAAKTNIEPWHPTTAILDSGIYAVSRNPIYVAMVEIYLGFSLIFNSVWFLPFLPLVVLAIHFGVIRREERYLEAKFGEEYLDYKSRVRRWI
ncbi:MAG: isoprenylcysteine carboxylmethyltransferase family protein [Acidobacteria bacterium]|nr:isoprenylcysteine carboxylmethyltransferase family protein [Acidobacteriota bacterium]